MHQDRPASIAGTSTWLQASAEAAVFKKELMAKEAAVKRLGGELLKTSEALTAARSDVAREQALVRTLKQRIKVRQGGSRR